MLYFAKRKGGSAGVFAAFCLVCMAGAVAGRFYYPIQDFSYFTMVFFRPVPVPDGAGPALYAALQRTAGEGAEMVLLYLLSRPSICYLCGGDGSAGSVLTPQI